MSGSLLATFSFFLSNINNIPGKTWYFYVYLMHNDLITEYHVALHVSGNTQNQGLNDYIALRPTG